MTRSTISLMSLLLAITGCSGSDRAPPIRDQADTEAGGNRDPSNNPGSEADSMTSSGFAEADLVLRNVDTEGVSIAEGLVEEVRFLRDITGDGRDELVINDVQLLSGQARLQDINPSGTVQANDGSITSASPPADAVDFNGDGLPDRLSLPYDSLTSPYTDIDIRLTIQTTNSTVASIDAANTLTITGSEPGQMGFTPRSIGDVNDDGFEDVALIPAGVESRIGGANTIFYGSENASPGRMSLSRLSRPEIDRVITSAGYELNLSAVGSLVLPLGDINGDGFADIAMNYTRNDEPGKDGSRVLILFGSSTGTGSIDELDDTTALASAALLTGLYFESAVGDIDGDGRSDFRIALDEPQDNAQIDDAVILRMPELQAGLRYEASVLESSLTRIDTAGTFFDLQRAGDVDGDGIADMLATDSDTQNTLVVYGGSLTGVDRIALAEIDGVNAFLIISNERIPVPAQGSGTELDRVSFNVEVFAGGDLNGDGFDDLALRSGNSFRSQGSTRPPGLMVMPGRAR